jgi:hypothetical protein
MSSTDSVEASEKSLPAEAIDVERLRSSITRLTSNSTDELEKLMVELERLQEFLKSETERVHHEIEGVLDGIGIIIEALGPWKTAGLVSAQNTRTNDTRTNGRDKLKRWP